MKPAKPLIGITSDHVLLRNVMPAAAVYDVYTRAVANAAGGLPWIIPPLGADLDLDEVVARLDAVVFTGSRSNIQPERYEGGPAPENNPEDPDRDSTTLPLIPKVLEAGIPALCICRGMQELNVALGGTLHQEIHKLDGRADHRAPDDVPVDEKFAPAHEISIEPGGMLAGLSGRKREKVNSVHGQGIDRLAPPLRIEARADDGTIEAVSVHGAGNFALGVQWHPEWDFGSHPFYRAIWEALGEAGRKYLSSR
jgi:putative glutamine amidotransferase